MAGARDLSRSSRCGLTRCCSRSSTKGDTNLETSPPRLAISRTNVPRDELVLVARRQEHGLDVGHQLAVHAGHLELVLEVAHRAQAAHDDLAAVLDDEIAQQAAKRHHLDVRVLGGELGRDVEPLGDREHRALVVAGGDRDDQALEQPAGAAHQVLVPEGHRIEGAGVDGGQSGHGRHGGLHAAGDGGIGARSVPRRSVAAPQAGAALRSRWQCTAPARACAAAFEPGGRALGRDPAPVGTRHRRSRRRRRRAPPRRAPARAAASRTAGRGRRGRTLPAAARAIQASASARSIRTASAPSRCARRRQAGAPAPDRARAARPRRRRATPPRSRARPSRRTRRGSASRSRSWPSQLNSVSRTRSGVGRRPGAVGDRQLAALPCAADDADLARQRSRAPALRRRRARFTAAPGCRRAPAAPWPRRP